MQFERATIDRAPQTLDERRQFLANECARRGRFKRCRSQRESADAEALRELVQRFNQDCRAAGRPDLALALDLE